MSATNSILRGTYANNRYFRHFLLLVYISMLLHLEAHVFLPSLAACEVTDSEYFCTKTTNFTDNAI
jgi:hypothetical protein